jgi:UDP-N-acetylmuramate--alanine ligase
MRRQPIFGRIRTVHFVGIGGNGMSSMAEVLLRRGYGVTGSDQVLSPVTDHLKKLGADVFEGHAAEHVGDVDVVVYSSAVDPLTNAETLEARRQRLPVIRRAELLGELMRMHYGIGIAGTHGKTTTTTMTGLVVQGGGFDPTIIVGGKVSAFGSNAVAGQGDIVVLEADEYDRTFLRLTPAVAVITNIEADHLDTYGNLEAVEEAFVEYANSVPFFGVAIACLDDEGVQRLLSRLKRRVITYGLSRQASVRADDVRHEGAITEFEVVHDGERLGRIALPAPGLHNLRNALAAVAVGLELDMRFDDIAGALEGYSGVERRFQVKGETGGIVVIDDYAHHPTEVEATLEAAQSAFHERRVVAVFQPHLYSRTRDLMDAFARAFFNADVLILTDVYGARERSEDHADISGATLAERARWNGHRNVVYVPDLDDLDAAIDRLVRPGDLLLTMGAGPIYKWGESFLARRGGGGA